MGIDGAGVVIAASLLTVKFFRKGSDWVAAGFLVFAIGEGVILSGAAATLAWSLPSFAAGTALWATGLLLSSLPKEFAAWLRTVGVAGAILFAITSLGIFWGEPWLPTAKPVTRQNATRR